MTSRSIAAITIASALAVGALSAMPLASPQQGGPPPAGGPPPGQRGGGPGGQEVKLVKQFDADGNGRLNRAERDKAREFLDAERAGRRGRGPGGGRGGRGGVLPGEPGKALRPADVVSFAGKDLYDPATLRTIFLSFEDADWEDEMAAFNNTDVELPATVVVDGRTYRDVGVHFRGASSFSMVPAGSKRSLNLSFDFAHDNQTLGGFPTLNLLNAHGDPTFLRTVLFLEIARAYVPAPRANLVKVAINGENWGVYVNAEQFNKELVKTWFQTTDGARWKVPGSPGGRAGFEYLGDDPAQYKRLFEIKSKDEPKAWDALINLARVLNTTAPEALEAALAPILDVDGALKFLALDAALVNNDGYWVRASDFSLYLDVKGRFHLLPHDANETFPVGAGRGGPPPTAGRGLPGPGGPARPGGPGGGRGMGGGNVELDPLVGLDDETKPLRSKLLAVPALRERYLGYVREIATKWLDKSFIDPWVDRHGALIAADVREDTRKHETFEAFEAGLEALKAFAVGRRAVLLGPPR